MQPPLRSSLSLSLSLFFTAHSLEEASETLKGHTLKLRCLEGLWRQAGSKDADEKGALGVASGDTTSKSGSSGSSGSGGGGSSNNLGGGVSDSKSDGSEEGRPLASTAPALRAGLSGLLKRLGSSPLSSSQKEVRGYRGQTPEENGATDGRAWKSISPAPLFRWE